MATCKWCGQSGWFFSVNSEGLCKKCTPYVLLEVSEHGRIITESVKLINESKNAKTRVSRCDLVIEHAEAILKYEQKRITTITPPPSTLIQQVKEKRDDIILDFIKEEQAKVNTKTELAATPSSVITSVNSALLRIREWKSLLSNPELAEPVEVELKNLVHSKQLESMLDAARKAEFKGQKAKAIDQYQEALYFIRNDKVNDGEQKEEITRIEAKLGELNRT